MNTALWIVQGILGPMFLLAGFMKATKPREKLAEKMPWVNDFSPTQVKLIGTTQVLAGFGLVLPWLTGILPFLTVLAALGLIATMIGAAIYHLGKNEYQALATNFVIAALAGFVAYGRFMS